MRDTKVLPRDAKLGTTVEHVKQLRDDIASTTSQTLKDHSRAAQKTAEERATRIEARLSALEVRDGFPGAVCVFFVWSVFEGDAYAFAQDSTLSIE